MRLARQGSGFTQQEVAKKVGVSLRTYQRLESGQTPLDVATLFQFSQALDVDFLGLTSPEIQPEQVQGCEFFKTEEEFLSHPKVNKKDILKVKNEIIELVKNKPEELLSHQENFDVIYEVKTPLLLADAQTTVANSTLSELAPHFNESKWKTASKFSEPINFIKAINISLQHNFRGFKIKNPIEQSMVFEKFYLILNPDPMAPLAIGQVV